MSLKDVLSQNHIVDSFKKAIANNRLSHAYIFIGQKGGGKTLFAKEFTKVLFCKNGKGDPCDTCHNCIRVDKGSHPDIYWIVLDKKDKFIKIEAIRDLQHSVNLSPVESEHKVFIIKDADKMNEEASSCLLKTLEEPAPNTVIILLANSLTPIRKTIQSRCQIIRFHPMPIHVIKEQLINKFDADTKEIDWVSRFSCGSLGNAIEFLQENFYKKNNDIINRIPELNLEDNLIFTEELIESYLNSSDSLEEKRQILKSIFNCILQFYRDLLMVKIRDVRLSSVEAKVHGIYKEKIPLFNRERENTLQTYCSSFTQEQIMNTIDEIIISMKYLDYNLNINLLIENIITKITMLNSSERQ